MPDEISPGIKLYLLGSPRIEYNGKLASLETRKAIALLAYLALTRQVHHRDTLAALLWPDQDQTRARGALRTTLSVLHKALGKSGLEITRDTIGLDLTARFWLDVTQFQDYLAQCRTHDHGSSEVCAACLPLFRSAVELYRDDFMAGFSLRDSSNFDDWQSFQTNSLRQDLANALEKIARYLSASGELEDGITYTRRWLALDPLHEEAHRQLMRLYAGSGQHHNALQQYRDCMRILEQELGVDPLEETTQLYQQILSGKLATAIPVAPEITARTAPQAQPGRFQPAPLVGRERELAALERVLGEAQPTGMLIAIEGEAGVGKTRLAEEFIAQARLRGQVVAQARCYEGQAGLAYAPFLEGLEALLADGSTAARLAGLSPAILAEAARLFPGLTASTKDAELALLTEGPGAQTRFFEALRQLTACLLGGSFPGILFLDDLQWADSGTLDLFIYLARRVQPTGCFILGAWRSEQSLHSEHLAQLLAELQRADCALHLPLARLNLAEIGELANSTGAVLPPALTERLYLESEGLPFIALEYLHSLDQPGADWKMPGGVRALLHRRLQAPGEAARQLLAAAAVIGRSFDFGTLHVISGRSEWETISGLEELLGLGLIREQGNIGYDFSHEKLRAVAYEETSTARRRLLHLRAGETLAAGHAGRDSGAGLAAYHFLQAGQPAKAAEFFRQAGDYARRLHANSEALAAYQAAVAAGHPDLAGLHEASGDLYTLLGNYREAVASYQVAATHCTPGCLSNLMHKLGEVYHRRGEWEAAEGHYRAALEAGGTEREPAWQAHLFADWSLTAYRAAQTGQAQELAEKALEMAQIGADPTDLSKAFNMLGILARARGELDQAGAFFERSLAASGGPENLALRCAALHNLARLEQEHGRVARAIPLAHQALEFCTRLGDRHHQAALFNTLADLYHADGRETEAMIHLKQAVVLFAEIGEDAGRDQPEIWKLTEW